MILARLRRIARDLSIASLVPPRWSHMAQVVLKRDPCPLAPADIIEIMDLAGAGKRRELAYLATVAGLRIASGAVDSAP